MSISRLPSGRWRAQVYDSSVARNVSVSRVLSGPGTFATKREAKAAREAARARLAEPRNGMTVSEFRDRWLTDPLFARPKQATMLHNAERTKAFSDRYGRVPLIEIGDGVIAEWLTGGARNGTVPALRAMFNDALSAKAGRLIPTNPFAGLGLARPRGNASRQPPSQDEMERLIQIAKDVTPPSFAAYLEFGCLTAMRPSELDALKLVDIDVDGGEIHVRQQWNTKTRTFCAPKYGPYTAALVGRARDVLHRMPRDQAANTFVFTTLRGHHYTPSTRSHHWNRVRCAAGLPTTTLYLATRHYFGWYALNVLELAPHIVAEQLGHKDGGKLIVELYGHPDKARARRLIREAHDAHGRVRPLRIVREESA